MKNVSELKNYDCFRKTGLMLLHRYLKELLNCEVNIEEQPIDNFSKYMNIDFEENIKQYAYVVSENKVVLSIKVIEEDAIIALLPIYLVGKMVGMISKSYLEQIGSAISIELTKCYKLNFNSAELLMGDSLENRVIHSCFAKRIYEVDRFNYLISYLKKLCLLTFENECFNTGFILTNSGYDYVKETVHKRNGIINQLSDSYDLNRAIRPDRRFWYMADGKTTYYLLSASHHIESLFTAPYDSSMALFWKNYSMEDIIWGVDIAFRVINHNQISIMASDGVEFIGIENTWKMRDYKIIKKIVQENANLTESIVDCVLYYVMNCAQTNKSTILWLPSDVSSNALETKLIGLKKFFMMDIDITDERNIKSVERIISSDGVTVVNNNGKIIYNGCVVNLAAASNTKKLTGTGETAARLLASNGIAIKVSQDGIVKIFFDENDAPYTF